MIRPRSVCCVFILGITCGTMLLAGCEELKQFAPPEMKKYVDTAARVGEGAYNRPKFTEADEERMAQDNAKKFEEKNGSSPSRVDDLGLSSDRVEHAGEDFQAQVLLVA